MALNIAKSVIYMGGTGTGASATNPVDVYTVTADDRNAYNITALYNVIVAHADFIGNTVGTTETPGGTTRGKRVFNITHLGNTWSQVGGDWPIGTSNISMDSGDGFNTGADYAFYGEFGDALSYGSRVGVALLTVNFTSAAIRTFANGRTTRNGLPNDTYLHQFNRPAIINCAFRLTDQRVGANEINFFGDSRIWLNLIGGGYDTVTTAANGSYTSGTTFTVDGTIDFFNPPSGQTATANILNSGGAVIDTFTYTGFNAGETQFTGVSELGAVADNATVSQNDQRAQVTLGLERFDTTTATVDINYQQPISDIAIRPWDFRGNSNNQANQIEYYILGRSHGTVNMVNNETPIVNINMNATSGWNRFDGDLGTGETGGVASFALNIWAGSTQNRVHSGAGDELILASGCQVYGRSATLGAELRPDVAQGPDQTIGSQAYNWPNAFITSTQLADNVQHNVLYPQSGANRLWTIYDYPYTGYGMIRLGFTSNSASGYQGCSYYIDPSTPTPTNITHQGALWHGANSNIIFSSSYQPIFLRSDETESDDGAIIRIRNNNLPLFTGANENFDPTASSYTNQPREFNNIDLEAFGWQIDKSAGGSGKDGYLLHWAISANRDVSAGGSTRALLRHYSGDYNVIHAGPGMESVTLTKDPVPTSGVADRNVSDTVVADTILGYSDTNRTNAPIEYGQAGSDTRIFVSGGTETISAVSGSTITLGGTSAFFPGATGGTFYHDNQKFNYTGVSGNTVTGVSPTGVLAVGDTVHCHELRDWQTENATINADEFASSVISFPWQATANFSSYSNGVKNTNINRYVQMWEGINDYDGDIISVEGSVVTLKNKDSLHPSRIAYATGHITTRGTQYDTIATTGSGWTDLNNQQLDCTTAGGNHVFVGGNATRLFTTTTFPTLSQYAMRGNTQMSGSHSLTRPSSGDLYIQYIDCARNGTFTVSGINPGGASGTIRVVGAPAGTVFSPSAWVVPVSSLTITTQQITREARTTLSAAYTSGTTLALTSSDGFDINGGLAYANGDEFRYTGISGNSLTGVSGLTAKASGASVNNGTGRLSLYTSGGTLIGSYTSESTSGFTVDATTGLITYVFASSSHASLPAPSGSTPPTLRAVWTGPGGRDTTFTISFNSSSQEASFTRGEASTSTATSYPSAMTVNYSASTFAGEGGGPITWRISGARGGNIPSTAQLWYFIDNELRGSATYNSFIERNPTWINAMSNNGHYSLVNGDRVRMAPQESNSQSVGYIENTSTTDPQTAIGTPNGSFDFNIAADPPGINPRVIQDALDAFDVATQQDVDDARNVVLGNL